MLSFICSCTKADAWALVIDAGHINVESNLAPKEAVDKVLAKQGMEYSEEDFKELESLVYDKFTIKLTETKVLIAESVDRARQEIQSANGTGDMHLIEQIDMDFLCETCIVPKSTQLTKIKISGHLPLISINFSDRKYKTLMNVIDIIVPSIDDDAGSKEEIDTMALENTTRMTPNTTGAGGKSRRESSFGKPVWESSQPELLLLSDTDESDDETAISNEESDSTHSGSMSSQSKPNFHNNKDVASSQYKQTNFSLAFRIDRVKATLKEAHSEGTADDILLCDIILEHFILIFTQRIFDMTVEVSLKTLSVIDKMEHGSEFTYLITSDRISRDGETYHGQKDLVNVQYKKINSKSPEYNNIDQSVNVELSELNIIVTRSSILTLYNFILSTFTSPPAENAEDEPASIKHAPSNNGTSIHSSLHSKETTEQPPASQGSGGSGVIKVQVCLESLGLILNDDGIRLATGTLSHGDVAVLVKPTTLSVDVKIGNFELKDDTRVSASANEDLATDHSSTQLLSLEGKELATFRYTTYDKAADRYPGYDQLIFLRMGALRLTFIEHTIHQLAEYGSRFAEMKDVYDTARQAAVSSAQQMQQSESLLHYDIRIRSPTVVFPSTDPKNRSDQLVARLGEISIENKFSESKLELKKAGMSANVVIQNTIKARVHSMNLKSEFTVKDADSGNEQKQVLSILKEMNLDFTISSITHTRGALRPDTQVTGLISDIRMDLTERQFKFLIDTSNSVTAAFKTNPGEGEDMENDTADRIAFEAIESVGVRGDSKSNTDAAVKDAVRSEVQKKDTTPDDEHEPVWSTMDLTIEFDGIKLEIFSLEGSVKQDQMYKWSLASFALENTSLKLCNRSDSTMSMELQIESVVLKDTRNDVKTEFREIMHQVQRDGPQLQLRYETSTPNSTQDQFLLVALDTPHIILSVDHVFALQKYFMAPFTVEEATEAQMFAESQKTRASADITDTVGNGLSQSRPTHTTKTQNVQDQPTPQGALNYRINIVDPEVILLANPSSCNSEAIVLSANQILLSQQSTLTLNVSKIGMFLCAMNRRTEATIRFVEEFEISMSMESQNSANHKMTNIVIDLQALIIRVSYLDMMLINTVINRALELMGESSSTAPPEAKENDVEDDKSSTDKISETIPAPTDAPSTVTASAYRKRMSIEPYIVMSRETVCVELKLLLFGA
jgi:vacuolar protein sorting-associated protein 13A/C